MPAKASGQIGFFAGFCLVLFTLFGAIAIIASLNSWFSDVFSGESVLMGRGKIIGFNERAPYDSTSRVRKGFTDYPVVEYHDEFGKRKELSDRSGFRGHFSIGEEVIVGKRNGRVIILDFWFRSHEPIQGMLVGIMAIGFAAIMRHKLRSS